MEARRASPARLARASFSLDTLVLVLSPSSLTRILGRAWTSPVRGPRPCELALRASHAARAARSRCGDLVANQCAADGTAWQEIGPTFFQPSRSNQVLG